MFSSPGEKSSSLICIAFPGGFSKYIFTASAHFINVGYCTNTVRINLKTLMVLTIQALIFVGGLIIDFRGDIHSNSLQKYSLLLKRVFQSRYILNMVYWLLAIS